MRTLTLITLFAASLIACGTDSAATNNQPGKVAEKVVTVQVLCTNDADCDKIETGAVCKVNGICYVHTTEQVIVEKPVEVPKTCQTDADCDDIETGLICKANGICYKQVHDTEVVYGGCTENVQCHGGYICESGFCIMPTPSVCGTERVYDTDGQHHTMVVNGTIEFDILPDNMEGVLGSSKVPTNGDNLLPFAIRAGGGTCKSSTLTGVNFTVYQSFLPNMPAVMPQIKVQDNQGNQLGNELYHWREVHNGSWIEYDFRWTGALEIRPGHIESFNVICTNCSNLPAHTAFYTMTDRQYKYRIEADPVERIILDERMERMMIYGNPSNLEGFTCESITNANHSTQTVTAGVNVSTNVSGLPTGFVQRRFNHQLYQIELTGPGLSVCHDAELTEISFRVSGNALTSTTNWKIRDENNELIATTNAARVGDLVTFQFATPLTVNGNDPRYLPRTVKLYADTNLFSSGMDLDVQFPGAFSWRDSQTGDRYTSLVVMPVNSFYFN